MKTTVHSAARAFLLLASLLAVPTAFAEALSAYHGAFVENSAGQRQPMEGEYYDRYTYPVIAGRLEIALLDNGLQRFVAEDGETWVVAMEVIVPNGVIEFAKGVIRYNGATQCLEFNGTPIRCEFYIPEGTSAWMYQLIDVRFGTQCLPQRYLHNLRAYDNGTEYAGSPRSFTPVRFNPKVRNIDIASGMTPDLPANSHLPDKVVPHVPATPGRVTIVVGPDIECGIPLADVAAELKTEVEPSVGSHTHILTTDVKGSGKFRNPANPAQLVEKATGKTDGRGEFSAVYVPGVFGIGEKVIATVSMPEGDGMPASSSSDEESFEIRVAGLTALQETADSNFVFHQSLVNCAHNPPARYLDTNTKQLATLLAGFYSRDLQRILSFNDGSTEFGGVLDQALATDRDKPCHTSHRRGIDFDLNRTDGGDLARQGRANMVTTMTTFNDLAVPLWVWVAHRACDIGLERVPERGSFHLRNDRGCVSPRLEKPLTSPGSVGTEE